MTSLTFNAEFIDGSQTWTLSVPLMVGELDYISNVEIQSTTPLFQIRALVLLRRLQQCISRWIEAKILQYTIARNPLDRRPEHFTFICARFSESNAMPYLLPIVSHPGRYHQYTMCIYT